MYGRTYKLFVILSMLETIFTGLLNPDFESEWLPMLARDHNLAILQVEHGLGEVPILVDVQVKSVNEPNLDFIFPAVGSRPRDDDDPAKFGGIIYLYNNESVVISAPERANAYPGFAIYTGEGTYYTGLNQQESLECEVRVRAWLTSSLPPPDFNKTGMPLRAASSDVNDVYIEESHGLGEYPILAKVRTMLTDGDREGWYSDAVGSSMVAYRNQAPWTWSAFVIYGYSNESVRVWATSLNRGKLFDGTDGYGIGGNALTGDAELYAWKTDTLSFTFKHTAVIGPGYINEKSEFTFGYNFSSNMYLVSTVEATGGPNIGYRFPGSGALAYTTRVTDNVCSYGGLVYAYTSTAIRYWRPEPVINGGMVCIASIYGKGTNTQSDPHGKAVTTIWASSFEKVQEKQPLKLKVFNWTPVEPRCVREDF